VQEERGVDNPAVSPLLPCVMFQWGSAQEPVVHLVPGSIDDRCHWFRSMPPIPTASSRPSCSTTALLCAPRSPPAPLDIGVRLQARASRVTARVEHLWKPGRRIPGPPAVPSMTVRMSIRYRASCNRVSNSRSVRSGLPRLPRHHISSLITGRVGYVRATSVNPAAENIATVPVKMADPPTRAALSAATSTG